MNFKVLKACYPSVRRQEEEEYLRYLEAKEKARKMPYETTMPEEKKQEKGENGKAR